MMELDFTNEVTINELVQICKIVKSKKAKQDFLEKIANKLTKENYTSLNQTLKEDIKDLFRETYNNDVFVLLERVFQQPSAQNIVIQVIPDNQNQPNIISKNQGEVENVKHNTSQRLDFSDLSFNNATCSSSAVNFAIQQDDDVSGDVNLNTNNELIRTEELVPDTQLVQKTTSASETGNSEHNTMSSIEDDGRNPVNSKRTIKRKLQLNKPSSSKEFSSIAQEEELKKKKQRMELQLQESRIENKLVNVISHKSSVNSKFKCKITETVFKFQNTPLDVSNFPVYLNKAFEEILTFLIKDAHPHHKIAIKMCLPDFSDRKPIGIPFTTISELKSNAITSVLGSVPQSATNFQLTDLLEVSSKILEIPYGKGRTNLTSAPSKTFLKLKIKSLVNVQLDNDIYCLPVALIFGKCIADNDKNKIRSFKRSKALLKKEVLKLNKLANINTDEHFGTNLVQLAAYQKALPKYNIIVFNDKRNFRNRLFNNTNRIQGKTNLNIAYFEDINHFTGIRNVRKFFNKRFQCDICLELYDRKNGHSCNEKCKSCEMAPPCDTSSATIYCNDCNRYFYGAACLEAHYISICAILKYCTTCSKLIDMRKRNFLMHSCDEKVCPICTNIVDRTHCCYVQKYKHQAPSKFSIIFYDLKCTHNLNMGNDTYFHKPNLCVAHIVCNNCFMFPMSDYCCTICNNRQHIFENNNEGTCVEQFLNFCELYLQHSISIFCIAHNFKAYDGQFILRGLVKRGKDVRPITGGMRIFRITYDYRIHFIDSLNFLPIPLSKFPDTFVLDNISKGWYPHLFNTLDNYNYIGSVPDKKYFGTGHMSEKELERFNIWYEERSSSGLPYDNRKELIEYCTQDVDILRRGCILFMNFFLNITSVNPLLQSFTLTHAVMLAFRKEFLVENTLGIVPTHFYHETRKTQSRIGRKWLIYENRKRGGKISYEVNLPTTNFYVDGYLKDTNTVYEVLECYWHGCDQCFLNRTEHLSINDTFQFRFDETMCRIEKIKSLGYNIVCIWQCKFSNLLTHKPKVAASLENDPEILHTYLNPRDAIYGGRTETFQTYYKANEGETIRYYDFTSLYPYVNKYCKNPIGHPNVYYKDECKNINIFKMNGLIKCSVLPPRDLLIPVLPYKVNDKVVFPLCRTCAENENVTQKCSHSEKERMLIGTWVLDEVKLGIKYFYKIFDIFEVWEYEISQYDIKEKKGGVFTEFMNCFLKLKQEASDWPANMTSDNGKEQFINDFYSHEGIKLDAGSIKSNPSQRGCSELALNAFWGEFVQRNVRDQTSIVHNLADLNALILSSGVVITDIIPIEEVLWVSWKHNTEDYNDQLKYVSLAIGAFTTANARIKLYTELSKIPNNVLYCDTDSIIFVEDDNNKGILKTGNFIGELTDKLNDYGKHSYIVQYESGGPKMYAFIVYDPITHKYFKIAKCNGMMLNVL